MLRIQLSSSHQSRQDPTSNSYLHAFVRVLAVEYSIAPSKTSHCSKKKAGLTISRHQLYSRMSIIKEPLFMLICDVLAKQNSSSSGAPNICHGRGSPCDHHPGSRASLLLCCSNIVLRWWCAILLTACKCGQNTSRQRRNIRPP